MQDPDQTRFDRCVDYVEFAARDLPATRRFYAAVFGWTFEEYGPDYLAFHDGRLGGGFFTAPPDWQPAPAGGGAPLVVLYAVNLEAAERRVTAADGRVVRPTFAFPGGRRFHFTDPSGNELAVWGGVGRGGGAAETGIAGQPGRTGRTPTGRHPVGVALGCAPVPDHAGAVPPARNL